MTTESSNISNSSTERILALLLLLMRDAAGREDIFASIAAYHRDSSPESQRRMLDRDIATLERAGIAVDHRSRRYLVSLSQIERKAHVLEGEQMHLTQWDAGILMWIPRQPMR